MTFSSCRLPGVAGVFETRSCRGRALTALCALRTYPTAGLTGLSTHFPAGGHLRRSHFFYKIKNWFQLNFLFTIKMYYSWCFFSFSHFFNEHSLSGLLCTSPWAPLRESTQVVSQTGTESKRYIFAPACVAQLVGCCRTN